MTDPIKLPYVDALFKKLLGQPYDKALLHEEEDTNEQS